MALVINQDLYTVTKQRIKNRQIKINLLNYSYQIVDEITGNVVGGTINVDANNDQRRSCNITMVIDDKSDFEIKSGGKIWLDKYIQIYVAEFNILTQEWQWVNLGIYIINTPTWSYDASTNALAFEGLDLMAKLTGVRNGYISDMPTVIPQGSNVRNAIISVLKLAGITKYIVEELPYELPYDIKVDIGDTVYNLLAELRDVDAVKEMFFDVNGVFRYQTIPSGRDEPSLIDDDIWNQVTLTESIVTDFESVKNVVRVFGKALDPTYFPSATTISGNVYNLTIADYPTNITADTSFTIGWVATTKVANPQIKVNANAALPLINEDGTAAILDKDNQYYVARYQNGKFIYLGYQQIYGEAKDTNPDSPFYIGSTIGEIAIPLQGGEYDNIYTNDLANQRAKYELFLRTRMNDGVNLTCVPIWWLDVNIVVSYTVKDSTVPKQYIIKSFSADLQESGVQNISMISYYPQYESF
mgnify:CR=1 FL=1